MDSERFSLSLIRKPREDRWRLGTIWEACFSQKQHYSIYSNYIWIKSKSFLLIELIMIPEEIWYLFIFPWILFIANIPGAVITYMALGAVATFSAYIPGLGGSKDSWKSDLNSDSINCKISCQKGWWSFYPSFFKPFSVFFIIWIVPSTVLLFRRFAGYKKMIAWNNKTWCRRLPVWSGRYRGISDDGMILPV